MKIIYGFHRSVFFVTNCRNTQQVLVQGSFNFRTSKDPFVFPQPECQDRAASLCHLKYLFQHNGCIFLECILNFYKRTKQQSQFICADQCVCLCKPMSSYHVYLRKMEHYDICKCTF